MNIYRADLHIHTVLSPCGDLNMSPANIINEAIRKGLEIIGITDHNSTRHCSLVSRLGSEKGIFVMQGAEVTTKEEVHCLVFFEKSDALDLLQGYLDRNLPDIKNDPLVFGDQVAVNENEEIIYTEEKLLINATAIAMNDLEAFVHRNNGIFIPAHIDRPVNSVYSQLGFLPENMEADALEINARGLTGHFAKSNPEILSMRLITGSDAHYIHQIGSGYITFMLNEPTFEEVRMALKDINNRKIIRQ